MNRHYKTLELDKILERLAGMTSIEDAREMALNLEPVFELKKVEQLLQQTDDAVALSGRFGAPSFGGARKLFGTFTQSTGRRLPYHRRTSVGCINAQNNPHGQGVALTLRRRSKLS